MCNSASVRTRPVSTMTAAAAWFPRKSRAAGGDDPRDASVAISARELEDHPAGAVFADMILALGNAFADARGVSVVH